MTNNKTFFGKNLTADVRARPAVAACLKGAEAAHALVPCVKADSYYIFMWLNDIEQLGLITDRERVLWGDILTAE